MATSPTEIDSYGWYYGEDGEVTSLISRYYKIEIPEGSFADDFSVILTWNVEIDSMGSNKFEEHVTDPNAPVVVDWSDSSVDNIEHIYIGEGQAVDYLAAGTYTLEVSTDDISRDYGIAWRTATLFGDDPNNLAPSADFNEDGYVDGSDFLTWQNGLGILLNASHADGDADGDGDGDVDSFDLAIFEADYGISPLSARVVGVPEPGSLALLFSSLLLLLRRQRRAGWAWGQRPR